MQKRSRRPHGSQTRKISVSVTKADLATLSSRARRVHRGNVSAVIHEMIVELARQEALDALVYELGGTRVTEGEVEAIRAELATDKKRRNRRRAA